MRTFHLIALICLVSLSQIPSANALVVLGDINNDGKIGLAESIYALKVTVGDATGGVEIFSKEFLAGKTLYVVIGEPDEMELHTVVFSTDTVLMDGRTELYEILEGGVLKIHDTYNCGLIFITALQAFENYIFAAGNEGSLFLFYDRSKAEEFMAPLNGSACNPMRQATLRTSSPDCGGGEVNYGSTVYLKNGHDYFSIRATIEVRSDDGSSSTFFRIFPAGGEEIVGCTYSGTTSRSYSIIDAEFQEP